MSFSQLCNHFIKMSKIYEIFFKNDKTLKISHFSGELKGKKV
jgi:hypothetical protein